MLLANPTAFKARPRDQNQISCERAEEATLVPFPSHVVVVYLFPINLQHL